MLEFFVPDFKKIVLIWKYCKQEFFFKNFVWISETSFDYVFLTIFFILFLKIRVV